MEVQNTDITLFVYRKNIPLGSRSTHREQSALALLCCGQFACAGFRTAQPPQGLQTDLHVHASECIS